MRLIQSLEDLRRSLTIKPTLEAVDRYRIAAPFAAIIRSEEASGPITSAAFAAVLRFLQHDVFAVHCVGSVAAVALIADAVTHCRFEATHTGSDEVVLMRILQLQVALVAAHAGRTLDDEVVWNMIQVCECGCVCVYEYVCVCALCL